MWPQILRPERSTMREMGSDVRRRAGASTHKIWLRRESCTKRKVEQQAEREDGLNRDIGVDPLSTAVAHRHRGPPIAGFLTDPHRDVTASSECLVVLRPVPDSVLRLVLRVASRSFVRFIHRRDLGAAMRSESWFRGAHRQASRDSCTHSHHMRSKSRIYCHIMAGIDSVER